MNKQKIHDTAATDNFICKNYLSSYDLEQKIRSPHTEKQWDYIHEYQY